MPCTTDVLTIFTAAIRYSHPSEVCTRSLAYAGGTLSVTDLSGHMFHYDLSRFTRIVIAGAGKAVCGMAAGVADILSDDFSLTGTIISPTVCKNMPEGIQVLRAAHPFPDQSSIRGGRALLDLAATVHPGDFVIFLISGGASSLFTALAPGVPLSIYNRIMQDLFARGASIDEINTVRTAFSRVKGGQYGTMLGRAPVLTLALSDVPGDDPAVIGSGPTGPWRKRVPAAKILHKYNLFNDLPQRIIDLAGIDTASVREHAGKPPQNRYYHIIGGNRSALFGARIAAEHLKYTVALAEAPWNCSVIQAAQFFVRKISDIQAARQSRFCFLSGGETTVSVTGTGIGGRNQELALRVLADARTLSGIRMLSAGTDGIDGNSEAAGVVIDSSIQKRAAELALDPNIYLAESNANGFFKKTGGLVHTGHTGTNVMDLQILLTC